MTDKEKVNELEKQYGEPNAHYGEEVIINDLIYIIYHGNEGLSRVAIDDMLIAIGWHWTECKSDDTPLAKIKGCQYWSKEAFDSAYEFRNGNYVLKDDFKDSQVRHEHVVPKRVFRTSIENAMISHNVSEDEFRGTLKKALCNYFACVVTKEQAKKLDKYKDRMPNNEENDIFNLNNPWARYIEVDKENPNIGLTDIMKVYWRRHGRGWIPIGIEEGKIDDHGWHPTGVKRGDTETT